MSHSAWFDESKHLAGSRVYWSSISNGFLLERVWFTANRISFVLWAVSHRECRMRWNSRWSQERRTWWVPKIWPPNHWREGLVAAAEPAFLSYGRFYRNLGKRKNALWITGIVLFPCQAREDAKNAPPEAWFLTFKMQNMWNIENRISLDWLDKLDCESSRLQHPRRRGKANKAQAKTAKQRNRFVKCSSSCKQMKLFSLMNLWKFLWCGHPSQCSWQSFWPFNIFQALQSDPVSPLSEIFDQCFEGFCEIRIQWVWLLFFCWLCCFQWKSFVKCWEICCMYL